MSAFFMSIFTLFILVLRESADALWPPPVSEIRNCIFLACKDVGGEVIEGCDVCIED